MPGGIRIGFTVNTDAFVASLNRYLAAVSNQQNRSRLMAAQMKFLVRGLMDLTPPDNLAQGRRAVKADIMRAMSPWGGEDGQFSGIRNEGLRERLVEYQSAGEYDKLKDVWAKIGGGALKLLDFSPDLHHSVQNSRGQVPSAQGVMVPQRRAWLRYVKDVQGQVGRARGGWAAAAAMVGLSVPQWVERHITGGSASRSSTPTTTTMTFINRSVFVPRYQQNVELALSGRQKAMETDMRRFLQDAKTFANL